MQQGKLPEAERAIKTLYGKERVAEVIQDFTAASQGSVEPEAGWSDLFSSRYWKGNLHNLDNFYLSNYICALLCFFRPSIWPLGLSSISPLNLHLMFLRLVLHKNELDGSLLSACAS